MSASVLLKVANGPQGLGRDYASLEMKRRTRINSQSLEDTLQVKQNWAQLTLKGGRQVGRQEDEEDDEDDDDEEVEDDDEDDDEEVEEEGEDQGWWAASTSRHNAPWEASIVVAWPLDLLWISNARCCDEEQCSMFNEHCSLNMVIVVAHCQL